MILGNGLGHLVCPPPGVVAPPVPGYDLWAPMDTGPVPVRSKTFANAGDACQPETIDTRICYWDPVTGRNVRASSGLAFAGGRTRASRRLGLMLDPGGMLYLGPTTATGVTGTNMSVAASNTPSVIAGGAYVAQNLTERASGTPADHRASKATVTLATAFEMHTFSAVIEPIGRTRFYLATNNPTLAFAQPVEVSFNLTGAGAATRISGDSTVICGVESLVDGCYLCWFSVQKNGSITWDALNVGTYDENGQRLHLGTHDLLVGRLHHVQVAIYVGPPTLAYHTAGTSISFAGISAGYRVEDFGEMLGQFYFLYVPDWDGQTRPYFGPMLLKTQNGDCYMELLFNVEDAGQYTLTIQVYTYDGDLSVATAPFTLVRHQPVAITFRADQLYVRAKGAGFDRASAVESNSFYSDTDTLRLMPSPGWVRDLLYYPGKHSPAQQTQVLDWMLGRMTS